mgnify:CR=1 FL=1
MFIMSLRRQVVYLTLCLALLFAILEPQSSRGLVFGWALGFWLAHIGCGLLLAVVAARVLTRCSALHTWPAWLQLLLAGLFGSLAFAPVALGLGAMFPSTSDTMMSDDWLDVWELAGGWQALVAEWLQLLPSYLCAWMLINAVPLVQMAAPNLVPAQAQPVLDSDTRAVNPPDASTDWLNQLPIAIGRSLLRIEADLHYLKVFTENVGQNCGVCLVPFKEGEWIRRTYCNHLFHQRCIRCLRDENLCPECHQVQPTIDPVTKSTRVTAIVGANEDLPRSLLIFEGNPQDLDAYIAFIKLYHPE